MSGWGEATTAAGPASDQTLSAMALQRAGEIGTETPNLGTSQAIGWSTPSTFERAWDATKNAASGLRDVRLSDVKQGMDTANATSQLVRGGIDAAQGQPPTPSPITPRPQGAAFPGATAMQFQGGRLTMKQLLALLQQGGAR